MELDSDVVLQFDYAYKIECGLDEPKCATYERDFYVSLEHRIDGDDTSHFCLTFSGQNPTEKNKMYDLVEFFEETVNDCWRMRY